MRKASLIVAALCVCGCAADNKALRGDLDAMRAEIQRMQRENAELAKRVDVLASRLDALGERPTAVRGAAGCSGSTGPCASPGTPPAAASSGAARSTGPASDAAIPPNLAVVKVQPPSPGTRQPAVHRHRRQAPPVPTAVPISEPDGEALASLGTPRSDLSVEAQADLDAAHRMKGLAAARALEAFAARYPRHPSADNALLDAARERAEAGEPDAACALHARCVEEYPAGDAMPDALELLGECHARRGRAEEARHLFERVVADYPGTSAAGRAAQRLAEAARAAPSRQGAVP